MRYIPTMAAMLACYWCSTVSAQPTADTNANRAVETYVYLLNAAGDRVLVNTQFWRNDPKYDDRAFHRFLDVLAALEKRGFHKDANAAIESWDKPAPYVRCYIYLEDRQAGRKSTRGVTTGSRVWCTDNGASEVELDGSDAPHHQDKMLAQFDRYFQRARANVHK